VQIGQLRSAPTTKQLIEQRLTYDDDPDLAVQSVLDFLRLWASFHFPRLLRALDRIQRDVFRRMKLPAGSYDLFASKVESQFLDSSTIALDEYGIPLESARKLEPLLGAEGNIDVALARVAALDLDQLSLDAFERTLLAFAIEALPRGKASRGEP
jgi:hypothetical protein